VDLLLILAVADIWGFLLLNPYWLLHTLGKTPNISHATTTGLESAGKKQLNPTVPELTKASALSGLIQNLKSIWQLFGEIGIFNEDFGSSMPSLSLNPES